MRRALVFSGYTSTSRLRAERGRQSQRGLFFADEIATALRAHPCRMLRVGGNIAALSGTKCSAPRGSGERHFAAQYDVSGFRRVGVLGIEGFRRILPDVSM